MPAARVVEVTVLGNTSQLEAALERSGAVAASSSAKIKASYAEAGAAAAKAAEAAGASADEQAAAAGRAAAAQVDANARITRAQQVAADAAAKAAEAAGASADEQVAAARRAAEAQALLEDQSRATMVAATEAGFAIGDSFERGSAKAGGAVTSLGKKLEGWGVPFAGGLLAVGKGLDEADTKGQHLTRTMSALGGATLLVGASAFAAVGAEGVHLAAGFQKSVASIAANSDIPVEAATKIGDAFLNTAGYMTISGNEMAKAFAPVSGQLKLTEGAALNTAQALRFMKTAADLAEGSQTDLTTATAALSQVMQSFHLPLTSAAQAADTLFNVSRGLNVPIASVGAAVDKLHGRLGILMPSLSDVSGLMIALGQHGIMGSRGIQVAQTALTKLTDGNQETKTVLGELGVSIDNSQGKFIGMAALIDELRPKLADLNQKSQEVALTTLFGSSAWEVMGQIIGAGVPKFDQATAAATKLGTAHKAASEQAKTLAGQVKILVASLEDMATKLGNVLIPVLNTMAQALSNTINWMEQHKAVAEALAAVIGGVLSVAVAVFAEQKMVAFGKSIQSGLQDLQKLGSWITGNLPDMNTKLNTLGDGMSKGVTTGAAESETALQEAKAPLATAATEDGTAIAAGMNEGGDLGMAGAVASAEAKLTAAKAPLAEEAAVDGTAAGGAFEAALATAATVGLAAAVGYALGKVTNKILGTGYTSAYNTQGSTAQQILQGDTTLVHGESLYKNNATGASLYSTLIGEGLSPAQIKTMFAALQATGQFKGGVYTGASGGTVSTVAPNVVSGFTNPNIATSGPSAVTQWAALAQAASKATGIPASLLLADIAQESGGNPNALSSAGAFGLTQFIPSTAAAYGVQPGSSAAATHSQVFGQANLLASGVKQYGSITAALEDYYGGPGGVANPNESVSGGPTPAQYAASVEAQEAAYAKYNSGTTTKTSPYGPRPLSAGGYGVQTTTVGEGEQGLPTGNQNLPNPAIQAASQKTVDAINTAFTAAVDKYSAAAKSATSEPLKVIDEKAEAAIANLKASFDKQASGLSGPALESLKTTATQQLTALEALYGSEVKNETTFEAIRSEITKDEQKYKAAAQSATTPLLAKLNTTAEQELVALDKHFTSPSQDYAKKLAIAGVEANTSARVKVGTAAAGYTQSALTATSPLLAQLDQHFATLLGDIASGKSLPAAGVVGRIEQQAKTQTALGGRAATALTTGEGNLNSSSYQTLASATTKIQKTAMDQLVKELDATHVSELEKLGTQLQTTFKQEETAKNNILIGDAKQEAATETQKITMVWQDASDEAVQAIKDAAQGFQDAASAMAQNISDIAQAASDTASGTSTLIADQAQTTVDTLGERGLYGLNLIAQQMTVAADQQKTAFDAQINVLQQQADSVQTTQDALVAAAQQGLDNITQSQDAVVQNATAHLDAVTAEQNAAIEVAQAKVDQGVAGSQAALAAAQGNAAAVEATAAQQLEQAQSTASGMEAQANAALSGAQAAAATAVAQAQAALSNAQSAAQIAEAQSQAEIAIEKEEAATQFAGSGTNIYISGINPSDAAAVASEVSWVARSQFTSPVA